MEPISKLVNIMMEGGDIDSKTVEDLLKEVKKAKEKFPRKKPTKQVVASCGILDEKSKVVRIEDHPQYKPYFDIKKNGLTSDATIKAHMEAEGLNPDLIDREGLIVRVPAQQYVGAPREYEGIIERILEKNSQKGQDNDERQDPEWSRTYVWNTETEQYHQCMPVSMFQEIKKFQTEQPTSKPTAFEGMDEIYHLLLDMRAKLMEEQRTLGALVLPERDASNVYQGKDGSPVRVDNPAYGDNGKVFPKKVSIDQCQAAETREQCYAHRDDLGRQGCLFMPDLAHLNPKLDGDAAEAWKTLKTAHCVDKRVVPFPTRQATAVDQEALQRKKKFTDENEVYRAGAEPKSRDISNDDIKKDEVEGASDKVVKMYNEQVEKAYQDYAWDDSIHEGGNLIPVFYDKSGLSTYKAMAKNSVWNLEKLLKSDFGGDAKQSAASKIAQAFRNKRNTLTKKLNGKIRTKLDNAYAAWEKKYKDVERYKADNKTETEAYKKKYKALREIVGRTIYEAARESPSNFTDDDLKAIVMHDRAKDERPLLITTEKKTCDKTLEFLHKNVATNITNENFAEQVNDNSVQLSAVLPHRSLKDNLSGSNLDKDQKDTITPNFTEEEMYNPNLRVVDLPKTSTENMFVLIGGGGNPNDYDANGKWIGGGGFQKDQNGEVKPGQFVFNSPNIETEAKQAVNDTNKCLFRIGINTIMLLKGAAAGGKFNEMTDRLKGIYKEAAGNVATNNDLNKFYHRLRSLTADQISWMEMVLYPDTVKDNKDNARQLYETMYKCSIGKWMRAYNYKTRQYQATKEAEDLQRTLEKADYNKLENGYNESVFSRLPCTFSANVFDAPATKFFDKWTYGNISGMAEVIKEGIPIVRIQRDEDTKEIKSRQIVSGDERNTIVHSVESLYWENLAKLITVVNGQFYVGLENDIVTFMYDKKQDSKSWLTRIGDWYYDRPVAKSDKSLGFLEYPRKTIAGLGTKDEFRKIMETNLEGWKSKGNTEREALEQLMDFLDAHPQTGNYQWWRDRFGTPMSIGV